MPARTRIPWIETVALQWESDECLKWPFALRGNYPALEGTYGHIYLCELVNGPKPTPEHEAEHTCGHAWCMNKGHLQWATHAENCARRTEHGTQLIGEKHNMVKLTASQVKTIRAAPTIRGSGVSLAERYGVSTATICLIRNRTNWRSLA